MLTVSGYVNIYITVTKMCTYLQKLGPCYRGLPEVWVTDNLGRHTFWWQTLILTLLTPTQPKRCPEVSSPNGLSPKHLCSVHHHNSIWHRKTAPVWWNTDNATIPQFDVVGQGWNQGGTGKVFPHQQLLDPPMLSAHSSETNTITVGLLRSLHHSFGGP